MSSTFTFIRNAILLLSFYTSTLSAFNPNPPFPPQNDAVSFLAFKSQADPGNKLRYSVNKTSAVCKWPGVQCQTDGKVVRLVLDSLGLAGVFAANTLTRMDQLRVLSLRNNSLTGQIPDLAGLANLKALYLDHNFFTGVIPSSVSSLHRLRTLDLSYNNLSGFIPVQLSNLDRLNYLRLDSNRLNGSIPPFNQSSLEIFNVSVNFLTGRVPATPTLARFGPSLFSVNPRLCGEIVRTKCGTSGPLFGENSTEKQSSPPPAVARGRSSQIGQVDGLPNSKSVKHKRIGIVIGFSVGLLVVITSALFVIMSIKTSEKRKKRNGVVTAREMMEMAEAADAAAEVIRMQEANELENKVRKLHQGIATRKSGNLVFCTGESQVFTVDQLMKAAAELLGNGTMGTTYKAVVDNRVTVCVKRLAASRLTEAITNEAFERHMEFVARLRHQNVVALGAYFQTKEEKLLVYDYQPNGSLFSLIHSKSTMAKPLHWTSCLKIAEDVAQGLCYLHQTCNVAHGNLKSTNVLLGSDFEARLSDSCISTLFHHPPDGGDGGSVAYMAPENEKNNEPTADSDVYAFGVVLLEVLTGKEASEHPELKADDVVKWVKSSRKKGGGGLEMEEKRLEMMTEVAIACCVMSPEMRPTMWQVIKMLQEIKEAAVMEDCGLDP